MVRQAKAVLSQMPSYSLSTNYYFLLFLLPSFPLRVLRAPRLRIFPIRNPQSAITTVPLKVYDFDVKHIDLELYNHS